MSDDLVVGIEEVVNNRLQKESERKGCETECCNKSEINNCTEDEMKKCKEKCTKGEIKFTFSSFKDANFEYSPDKKDMQLIQTITQYVVNHENKKYTVLERAPQALIRLAHEALVRPEKDDKNKRWLEMGDYMDSMEYGLTTKYEGPYKPFFYGVKIEGVEDTKKITQDKDYNEKKLDIKSGEESIKRSDGDDSQKKRSVEENNEEIKLKIKENSIFLRPILYAKIDIAHFLIVIDVIKYPKVEIADGLYYDTI